MRVESNSPGAPRHPLRHLRGLLPSPGASGPRAPSCLFTHFPEQPGCLTSGHTMQPCILEPPTPSPEGQRAQEVEGKAAAGPPEERGGKSGQSFCRTSRRQTGEGGVPSGSCQSLHPRPPVKCEEQSHGIIQIGHRCMGRTQELGLRVSFIICGTRCKNGNAGALAQKLFWLSKMVTTELQMPCDCMACGYSRLRLGFRGTHGLTLHKACYLSGPQFPRDDALQASSQDYCDSQMR